MMLAGQVVGCSEKPNLFSSETAMIVRIVKLQPSPSRRN